MDMRAHFVWQAGGFLSPPVSGALCAPLTGYLGVCAGRRRRPAHTPITEDKPLAAIVRVKLIHWIGLSY